MSDPTPATAPAQEPQGTSVADIPGTTTTHEIPPASNGPVKFFKRSVKKAATRKRAATPPSGSSDDDDSDDDDEGSKKLIKRTKTSAVTASSAKDTDGPTQIGPIYTKTSNNISDTSKEASTKSNNWMEEDAEANLLGRKKKPTTDAEEDLAGKAYKGAAAYSNFIKKPENPAAKHLGPQKASSNVRTITITDYAPDVCKDYKQTGFCGFGDTCKFLHAREDYAAGWKLDREWELNKDGKRKNPKGEEGMDEEAKELEGIPFKCVICKEDYKNPIKTKCGHYFCESCAIGRYKKNPGCKICGKRTDGVFNAAKNLRDKLKRKGEREEEKKRKEEEEKEAEGR